VRIDHRAFLDEGKRAQPGPAAKRSPSLRHLGVATTMIEVGVGIHDELNGLGRGR